MTTDTPTGIPMDRVIVMAKNAGVLDEDLAASLTERLVGQTVQSIGQTKFGLAEQLGDLPNAFQVAGKLLDFMREAELIGLPNATPTAPAQAPVINVVTPTHRCDMGLAELFKELVEHPEDADEIIGYIRAQGAVIAADSKLRGSGEWAIANDDGTINVAETLEYIRHLAANNTHPQRKWKGQYWPTTLERALGRDQRLMLYPFALDDIGAVLMAGPDRYGNYWSKLPDDIHEAILAAVVSGKLVVNTETDVRRITHELFAAELPPYLNDLVEEYRRDKARGNATPRYATPEQLAAAGLGDLAGSRHPFGGSPSPQAAALDPEWCRAQLEAVCKRGTNQMSGHITKDAIVVGFLKTMSGSIRLNNTIVLGDVTTMSGHITGVGYVLRGAQINTVSGTVSDDVYELDYVGLYRKAVELGIIVP